MPNLSVTRDWGYASGANAGNQLAGIGRDIVFVLDRNAVEANFKTLGTSQSTNIKGLAFNPYLTKDGAARSQNTDPMARTNAKAKSKYAEPTAKAGGEFEEVVVIPKGVLPLKGTMVGFWVNPKSKLMNDPAIINSKLELGNRIAQWIRTTDKNILVEFAGGEPLASLVYSKMFDHYSQFDNVKFILRTNGLLIHNNIDLITKLKDRLNFSVSIDAASKDTYEQKTRLGGRWEHLLEGLEIIKNLKLSVTGNFVIQKNNLHEVLSFVNLCQTYNLRPSFLILQDWGTWHDYRSQCVHFPDSELYSEFKTVITELKKINVDVSKMIHWIQ
jgi:hypothetical protein